MIKKIWENKRLRSLMWLCLWAIFLIGVYIVSLTEENNVNVPSGNETKTIFDIEETFIDDNYTFIFEYSDEFIKNSYTGAKLNDEIVVFRETSEGINKYYLKNDTIYLVKNGTLENIDNTNYMNYAGYLDIERIFALTKDQEYTEENNEYSFAIRDIYVKIRISEEIIEYIEVTSGNEKYELKFMNINEINEISY